MDWDVHSANTDELADLVEPAAAPSGWIQLRTPQRDPHRPLRTPDADMEAATAQIPRRPGGLTATERQPGNRVSR
jgi:hypothetical protein